MPKKASHLLLVLIILQIVLISHSMTALPLQDIDSQLKSTNAEFGRIISPTLVNPIIVDTGRLVKIHFQSNYSENPNEVHLFNQFLRYVIPIDNTSLFEIEGERISMVYIPLEVEPFLYNFELVYSDGIRILSFNSIYVNKFNSSQQIQSYSFIHITDLHIDGSDDRKRKITNLFSEINALDPDFVILTGDVVDGLTSDIQGEMVTAAVQFPQAVELLKTLQVPILVVNGNHDFQTNDKQDGNLLWEKYLGLLEPVSFLQYQQDTFVGTNLLDENGLNNNQLESIDEAFENATSLRIFFAHTDYKKQFPALYEKNNINIALLGHEHSSSINMVPGTGTEEFITDNSITFIDSEPGHYRVFSVSATKEVESQELEVGRFSSSSSWTRLNDSAIIVQITLRNNHNIPLFNITEKIIMAGNWTGNTIKGNNENTIIFNQTHTMLITKMNVEPLTESNFSIILTHPPSNQQWHNTSITIEEEHIITSTGSTGQTTSNSIEKRSGLAFMESLFLLLSAFCVLSIQRKK